MDAATAVTRKAIKRRLPGYDQRENAKEPAQRKAERESRMAARERTDPEEFAAVWTAGKVYGIDLPDELIAAIIEALGRVPHKSGKEGNTL